MSTQIVFYPPRRSGLLFHLGAILVLVALTIWGVWRVTKASIGPEFLFSLIPLLVGGGLTPILAYRGYALLRAYYILDRDGIQLHWGLRSEEIPINAVTWVRPADELGKPLPRPPLSWPGSLLGIRNLSNSGSVEYLAAKKDGLILVRTGERIYAISPEDPLEFMNAFQRLSELGSITPWDGRSVHPSFLLAQVWRSPSARYLILGGFLLNLALLTWVSLVVPQQPQVQLGFATPGETVPGVQLLLLPILSFFFYLLDFIFGLYFYRASINQLERDSSGTSTAYNEPGVLAYLLWGSGVLTPLLFLVAVFFILNNG